MPRRCCEAADDGHGIIGTVASLLHVSGGHEAAVAAALGWASEALAVGSAESAAAAFASLARQRRRAGRPARRADRGPQRPRRLAGPRGARRCGPATSSQAPARRSPPLSSSCSSASPLVPTAAHAIALASRHRGVTAVTDGGDVFGPGWARGGSSAGESLLEVQAAVEETREVLTDATSRLERSRFALAAARERERDVAGDVDAALEALHESDARMAAVAERLGTARGLGRGRPRAEAERAERAIANARETVEADRVELDALAPASPRPSRSPSRTTQTPPPRNATGSSSTPAAPGPPRPRSASRLRTKEERARALKGRADSLEGAARNEIAAREKLRERREKRRREAEVAAAVHEAAGYAGHRVARAFTRAASVRDAAEAERAERDRAASGLRAELVQAQDEMRDLTDAAHRDEMARTQQLAAHRAAPGQGASRSSASTPRCSSRSSARTSPSRTSPAPTTTRGHLPEPAAYVRDEQEKRLRTAERALAQLGRVNPLALEEFAALEERHNFLTEQLEDLKRPASATCSTSSARSTSASSRSSPRRTPTSSEQFERVFARLFPGGEGRLVLTDPDDMLTTGIEVEARPPGKKVKRLSLLSGGERSLVAVALLVAIFKARPSPVLHHGRGRGRARRHQPRPAAHALRGAARDSSQLIVITHQKRTMEVADALYGVSMRGDGVTTVDQPAHPRRRRHRLNRRSSPQRV